MATKKNVMFFVTSLQSGGIENYLLRFLSKYHRCFNRVLVYCKGGKSGQLELKYQSIPNVEIIKQKISFFNPLDYFRVGMFCKQEKIDVVCDFTGNFAGFILLTASVFGVRKRIAFYRGSEDKFGKNFFKSVYNSLSKTIVFKSATDILSNSIAAFNYFYPNIWQNSPRFEVIYNGIDSTQFSNDYKDLRSQLEIPSRAFVVGHTGRLNPAKNHETILKVAEKLIKKFDNIYFIMCGNNVKDNLEPIIASMKLQGKIKVFNNRDDISSFLKAMDCYYFPSLTEGQPNALIEAMVAGLPIVASNIDPIRETVPDELFPYLVPPLAVDQAVEKIQQIYFEGQPFDSQYWAVNNFDSDRLFQQFYNRF